MNQNSDLMLCHEAGILGVVLVLYEKRLEDTTTFQSLACQMDCHQQSIQLFIYDNSRDGFLSCEEIERYRKSSPGASYFRDTSNSGAASAYNWALKESAELGLRWLLLLDQDSHFEAGYIDELFNCLRQCGDDAKIAVILPSVTEAGRHISPTRIICGMQFAVRPGVHAVKSGLTAINAGATWRIGFLNGIGGFNPDYWLDFQDHWLFYRMNSCGYKAFLSGGRVSHELSVFSRDTLSRDRYNNILLAEALFILESGSLPARVLHLGRLAFRVLRNLAVRRDRSSARLELKIIGKYISGRIKSSGLRVPLHRS